MKFDFLVKRFLLENDNSISLFRNERNKAIEKSKKIAQDALYSAEGSFTDKEGIRYLITPSTDREVLVRVTRIDKDGNPLGHNDFYSEEEMQEYLKNSSISDAVLNTIRPDLVQGWSHAHVVDSARVPQKFIYKLRLRDAMLGTHPEGGEIVNSRTVEYKRPLTDQELYNYEMTPIGSKPL
jgi:hypothetical protein